MVSPLRPFPVLKCPRLDCGPSFRYLAGNDLVSLSEQQLTSCDRVGSDEGCGGGFSNLDTDLYATRNGGIASEADYPLCSGTKAKCPGSSMKERKNGVCHKAKEKQVSAIIVGGYQVSGGVKHGQCDWCKANPLAVDEELMKKHLVRGGPMTIAINSKFFDNYKRGIMKPAACARLTQSEDPALPLVIARTSAGCCTADRSAQVKVQGQQAGPVGSPGAHRRLRHGRRPGLLAH